MTRGGAFVTVGTLGTIVQLGTVAALDALAQLPVAATTLAGVELAVLHNFAWHERWTWADRVALDPRTALQRLARFNLATVAVSGTGSVAFSLLFLSIFELPLVVAGLFAIWATALANFLVLDRVVFGRRVLRRTQPTTASVTVPGSYWPAWSLTGTSISRPSRNTVSRTVSPT